jgi:hypothetical protein
MEGIDTGYPIVLKPSHERITASLKKMGKTFETHEGLIDGGVYPWISNKALESNNQLRKKLMVEEIRAKNEFDLKKLVKAHRTEHESTADKLDRFKNSLVIWNLVRIFLKEIS